LVSVSLRVLTWNLMHGRSVPPAGRDLSEEFADALARWDWDVALLQEVPPWWPATFGRRFGASASVVLTSRNFGLRLRRAVAVRWPDLIKSNGGGCSATLVRGHRIDKRRTERVAILPEARWLLGVRLTGHSGVWVGNLHANGRPPAAAGRELRRAARVIAGWAGPDAPIILGGDFNLVAPSLAGFVVAGGHHVDHVLVRGLAVASKPVVLDRGSLSDHAPVFVHALMPAATPAPARAQRSAPAP
jgi:endonuclease/exonuclease/phosphatase family metal-dependent hydrolase